MNQIVSRGHRRSMGTRVDSYSFSLDRQQMGGLIFGVLAALIIAFLAGFGVGRFTGGGSTNAPVFEEPTAAVENEMTPTGAADTMTAVGATQPPVAPATVEVPQEQSFQSVLQSGNVPGSVKTQPVAPAKTSSTQVTSTTTTAKPVSTTAKPAAPAKATTAASSSASAEKPVASAQKETGRFSIVTASLPVEEGKAQSALKAAEAEVARCRAKGLSSARYVEVDVPQGKFYRIIVKDSSSRDQAKKDLEALKKQGAISSGWIWSR